MHLYISSNATNAKINISTAKYTYVDKANKLILFITIFSEQFAGRERERERERERGRTCISNSMCTKRGVNIH